MRLVLVALMFIVLTRTKDVPSRTVNLELDTSFLFDKEDAHSSLINGLRTLLKKIDSHAGFRKDMARRNYKVSDKSSGTFTGFLRKVGTIILNYSDENFGKLAEVIKSEVEKYYVNGSVFHDIVFDLNLKTFVKNILADWSVAVPQKLKDKLRNAMENDETPLTDFLSALNQFYDKNDNDDLKELVNKFNKTDPKREDLEEAFKDSLDSVVFEKFNELNYTSKAKLAEEITKLRNYFVDEDKDSLKMASRRMMKNKSKKISSELSESERETLMVDPGDSLEGLLPVSDKEDNISEDKPTKVGKVIIINKDLEIFVRADGRMEARENNNSVQYRRK